MNNTVYTFMVIDEYGRRLKKYNCTANFYATHTKLDIKLNQHEQSNIKEFLDKFMYQAPEDESVYKLKLNKRNINAITIFDENNDVIYSHNKFITIEIYIENNNISLYIQ